LPAAVARHDTAAVWGELPKLTLDGKVQVRPDGEDADTDRLTVPVKPPRAVTVIVDVPCEPADIIELGKTGPEDK